MDDKAAFGFYPQLKPKRTTQDPEAAKNAPIDFLRGRVAGTLGMPGDIEQLARDLAMLAGAPESQSFLPTTERVLPNIPLGSDTPVSRAAAGLGSLTSNPLDVVKAGKLAGKAAKAAKPEVGQALEEYMFKQGLALPATVYHGSPHKFEKFDSSKIGTGEGAQAYGHGMYLAQEPKVAQEYQFINASVNPDEVTYNGKSLESLYNASYAAQDRAHRMPNGPAKRAAIEKANAEAGFWEKIMTRNHPKLVIDDALNPDNGWPAQEKFAKSLDLKKFGGVDMNPGNLYKTDLPDEKIAKMLDWDKPLSQQTPEVQKIAREADLSGAKQGSRLRGVLEAWREGRDVGVEAKGADLHHALTEFGNNNQAGVAEMFRNAGIPGIRYLDADSRAAGKGTSNFVVFPGEEDALTILERNQQPIKKESTRIADNPDAMMMEVEDQKFGIGGMAGKAVKSAVATRELEKQAVLRAEAAAKSAAKQALMPQYNEAVKGMTQKQDPLSFEQWKAINYPEGTQGLQNAPQKQTFKYPQESLPAEERDANLAKFLEGSKAPPTVYHATSKDFNQFSAKKLGQNTKHPTTKLGFFTAADPASTEDFITSTSGITKGMYEEGANVMPLHLSIKNPYEIPSTQYLLQSMALQNMKKKDADKFVQDFIDSAKAEGYDGLLIKANPKGLAKGNEFTSDNWVAFEPTQIKSSIGNRGTYDINEPDINKAEGGAVFNTDPDMSDGGRIIEGAPFKKGGDVSLDVMYMAVNDAKFRRK
jgi:hypothetical protein